MRVSWCERLPVAVRTVHIDAAPPELVPFPCFAASCGRFCVRHGGANIERATNDSGPVQRGRPTLPAGEGRGTRERTRVIKLRLRRMGAKKRPSYRIVAADSRSPRDGRFIETIGLYDPLTEPATVRVDVERARHWLAVGAQPTETVRDLLRRSGVTEGASAVTPEAGAAEAGAVAETPA